MAPSFEKVISAVVTSFLLFDVGASNFYATIIIPALTGLNTKNNPDEIIEMTAAEASWFGMFVCVSFETTELRNRHVTRKGTR